MKQENRDKEIYNSRICEFCKNKDICDKNKFMVYVIQGNLTMRCPAYEYKFLNEIFE